MSGNRFLIPVVFCFRLQTDVPGGCKWCPGVLCNEHNTFVVSVFQTFSNSLACASSHFSDGVVSGGERDVHRLARHGVKRREHTLNHDTTRYEELFEIELLVVLTIAW
jgi:hypothetical protein